MGIFRSKNTGVAGVSLAEMLCYSAAVGASLQVKRPTMELSLPSILGYEVVARDAVAVVARQVGIEGARVEDLKTALCEACTNAIEHGNRLEPQRRVAVRCWLDAAHLVVEVSDEGDCPFSWPVGDVDRPLNGLGLMLMRRLSDEAQISRSAAGTSVRMAFRYGAGRTITIVEAALPFHGDDGDSR
jgi:serine/threonine-protein kinase RsbW